MKTVLFISPYLEQNEARSKELETCYKNNLDAGFDEIYYVVERKDEAYSYSLAERLGFPENLQMYCTGKDGRPSIQTYIDIANKEYQDEQILVCFCNSDIFIDKENLNKLKSLPWDKNLFVALSRWDLYPNGVSRLLERADSQDFFAYFGNCKVDNAVCPLGMAGSDNSILHKYHNKGYSIVNPSKSVKIFHLHNVKIFNYREGGKPNGAVKAEQICPEPYYFKTPHL